ncbi:ACP S-malonyltransferase [Streptomyces sp. DSM 44915]|uniref:[acyl-carrier-protein] S-malonyltransferase n=1 Tax=Streptomyces chisholmiae TaxID=3075540 RepID=A0ABU2JX67_9ACTN|nr:ACP S-malonyltransferase [Streptomyces sp. DSM 44915]MDT0269592.1 ACP S-malonyltransferase [Streptomyces sp. DSM 44915]UZD11003.1 ACP malonyltransferase [Marinispora sp. CNQ-140]
MVAYLFPGQGSQTLGMGADLFDDFRDLTDVADEILGYSIRSLALEGPEERLNHTQYTQPALFVVNELSYRRLLADGKPEPDYVAGHSLGEYNALVAAGAFDFATGLRLVKRRGELMGQAQGGGMAAVVGLDEKEVRDILRESGLDTIDVANLNSPSQIVVSGLREDIERAEAVFKAAQARMFRPLAVSGAFHSRYMAEAQLEFTAHVERFAVSAPRIPVIANVTARPYRADRVVETLVSQISSGVRWSESIRYLLGKGEEELLQVGPGRVLTSLVRSIRREAGPLIVADEETEPATAPAATAGTAPAQAAPPALADAGPAAAGSGLRVTAADLGSVSFKRDYGLRYACVAGGMYRGIASAELVAAVARGGMLGFLGTAGQAPERVEADLRHLRGQLTAGEPFGVNLVSDRARPEREEALVDICLRHDVRVVEASSFIAMTPALVRYRLAGLTRAADGQVVARNRVIAKVSRPEIARAFLSPAPARLVAQLLEQGRITAAEAELAGELPVADDLCLEADSGGHTDQGVALTLLPAIRRLRDDLVAEHGYRRPIRLGAAGGIGTPDAAAACFLMGADFVTTGSINQCTVEAGTSDLVKDLLQDINIQDTDYAPSGDGFEVGGRVQVLKRGVLFPARANKLYELYKRYDALEQLDATAARQLQTRYFRKSFDEVYADVRAHHPAAEIEKAEQDPKHKMALVFKWYFANSTRQALSGDDDGRVDFQVHCGPALGAFNQWVKGTEWEDWRRRHVAEINGRLLDEAAAVLGRRLAAVGTA